MTRRATHEPNTNAGEETRLLLDGFDRDGAGRAELCSQKPECEGCVKRNTLTGKTSCKEDWDEAWCLVRNHLDNTDTVWCEGFVSPPTPQPSQFDREAEREEACRARRGTHASTHHMGDHQQQWVARYHCR